MTGGLVIVCHFVRQSIAVLFEKFAAISFQRGAATIGKQEVSRGEYSCQLQMQKSLPPQALEHKLGNLQSL